MRYFFDTEFYENGRTIDLISIGIVAEDGRELYLFNEEAPWNHIVNDGWLRENVCPHLPMAVYPIGNGRYINANKYDDAWDTRLGIKDQILEFVDARPEFWSYYADYDWVVFCQLFGRMTNLPEGFPMWCRDLKQLLSPHGLEGHVAVRKGKPAVHQPLIEARWFREVHDYAIGWIKNRYDSSYSPCGY